MQSLRNLLEQSFPYKESDRKNALLWNDTCSDALKVHKEWEQKTDEILELLTPLKKAFATFARIPVCLSNLRDFYFQHLAGYDLERAKSQAPSKALVEEMGEITYPGFLLQMDRNNLFMKVLAAKIPALPADFSLLVEDIEKKIGIIEQTINNLNSLWNKEINPTMANQQLFDTCEAAKKEVMNILESDVALFPQVRLALKNYPKTVAVFPAACEEAKNNLAAIIVDNKTATDIVDETCKIRHLRTEKNEALSNKGLKPAESKAVAPVNNKNNNAALASSIPSVSKSNLYSQPNINTTDVSNIPSPQELRPSNAKKVNKHTPLLGNKRL